ncbi:MULTISPECIES: photosystem II manganese-stabilizing polypeptide [Microcoleus]|uniref:photosystem II manganese-stabilizing polypeptide n=1 Tax=Microcoleus TaxID=44471 RepID=UPI00020D1699|nr:photosystem II manganese-stabilizing protein PsbO [Microcoleus vaginatus FGP-2]MBD1886920.1 photosystem II manganese-stabilizing polypeptide [Microcoleus sp. FACHB-84]MBD2009506.1 photosystem II manganese-stabilizing polypeptide [Microcoleus sp. FACHB-45]UNU20130.1 Photosystem II manganese-stabilizing polypeptide [Microcoleus vaginatus PCC 9802]
MKYRALIVALLAFCMSALVACSSASDTTVATTELLTYDEIRGTGLANNCPSLAETSRGSIPIEAGGTYKLSGLCLQPTTYFVKEEPANKRQEAEFVPGKLLTRFTSSIDQVQGTLKVGNDGTLTFKEEDGLDFQAITIQLPGGEQVPFLFTIKELVASSEPGVVAINTSTDLRGEFNVPSYRSAGFLDPKGRGVATGYDNAVALPASDNSKRVRANVKVADTSTKAGKISLQVAKVNSATGEIGGIFESTQPSDTDLGARPALDVKIRGLFYARIEPSVS